MTGPDDIVAWLERLGSAGFGTLLGLILFGNFLGIWVWGKMHREQLAVLRAELAKEEAEKKEWKDMALGLLQPIETTLERSMRPKPRG